MWVMSSGSGCTCLAGMNSINQLQWTIAQHHKGVRYIVGSLELMTSFRSAIRRLIASAEGGTLTSEWSGLYV